MPHTKKQSEASRWAEALERLAALEAVWEQPEARRAAIAECSAWLARQVAVPRLAQLAPLLRDGLTLRQFWSVRVPVERMVARCRVTDIEILDADLPPGDAPAGPPLALTIVADSIRSAFNLGGIFRTAECFGARNLILCGYTPLPDQKSARRAALGTEALVPWSYTPDVRVAIGELKQAGLACVALETVAGATELDEFSWPLPCALILGNERFGLDPDTVAHCDHIVRIPLYGRKNSLNVVSALAVALYAIRSAADVHQF